MTKNMTKKWLSSNLQKNNPLPLSLSYPSLSQSPSGHCVLLSVLIIPSQPFTSHFCLEIWLFWVIFSFIFAFFGLLTDLLWVDFPFFWGDIILVWFSLFWTSLLMFWMQTFPGISLFWVILCSIFAFFALLTDLLGVDFPSHFPFFEVKFFRFDFRFFGLLCWWSVCRSSCDFVFHFFLALFADVLRVVFPLLEVKNFLYFAVFFAYFWCRSSVLLIV